MQKKNELISDIKRVRDIQKQEKISQGLKMKNLNKDFARSIEKSYQEYMKEQENLEKSKKEKIDLYKRELDKQREDKRIRLLKPLMDENERLFNKDILS